MARGTYGAGWEELRLEVLERDGWRCQLPECYAPVPEHGTSDGRRIDPWRVPPDRWAPEVDHVVEVSRGGDPRDPLNLRAAHAYCNKRRNAAHRHRR